MGSSSEHSVSPAFAAAFRAALPPGQRALAFADFMELALYLPELGYYRRDRRRIGRTSDADFYTASSLGPVFGELVVGCRHTLLPPDTNATGWTFVEIGTESGRSVLDGVTHPFRAPQSLSLGDPLDLTGDQLIVFSNELFDAQ